MTEVGHDEILRHSTPCYQASIVTILDQLTCTGVVSDVSRNRGIFLGDANLGGHVADRSWSFFFLAFTDAHDVEKSDITLRSILGLGSCFRILDYLNYLVSAIGRYYMYELVRMFSITTLCSWVEHSPEF